MVSEGQTNNPWVVIKAVRHGAQRIYDTADRLGLRMSNFRDDAYESGRDLFPDLTDRMHLAAVLAKCGEFMARTEQVVKNLMNRDGYQIEMKGLWPQEAYGEVERHEINLGLAVSVQERSINTEREAEVENSADLTASKDTGYSI